MSYMHPHTSHLLAKISQRTLIHSASHQQPVALIIWKRRLSARAIESS